MKKAPLPVCLYRSTEIIFGVPFLEKICLNIPIRNMACNKVLTTSCAERSVFVTIALYSAEVSRQTVVSGSVALVGG